MVSTRVHTIFRVRPWNNLKLLAELGRNKEVRRIRSIIKESRRERSSYKEHTEDALVHGAEEGRDKLRKAAVSCK